MSNNDFSSGVVFEDTCIMPKESLVKKNQGVVKMKNGDTLGSYRILQRIGQGGMGVVYKAVHIHLKKFYAIKVLSFSDAAMISRFKFEARIMADMKHRNIVTVHQMDVDEARGCCYLVMDYISNGSAENDGTRLHSSLADLISGVGHRLSQTRVKEIILDVCAGLEYVHAFYGDGVAHRDIKPSNILLDKNGRAYISDFGIAKILGDEYMKTVRDNINTNSFFSLEQYDNDRSLMGTVDFMAPEEKRGEEITLQSDIYSIGVMTYRMLTGYMPIGAWKLPSKCGVGCSKKWDVIITRCLDPDLARRYASVDVLRTKISKVQKPQGLLGISGCMALLSVFALCSFFLFPAQDTRKKVSVSGANLSDTPVNNSKNINKVFYDAAEIVDVNGIRCETEQNFFPLNSQNDKILIEISISTDAQRWAVFNTYLKQKNADLYECYFADPIPGRYVRMQLNDPVKAQKNKNQENANLLGGHLRCIRHP